MNNHHNFPDEWAYFDSYGQILSRCESEIGRKTKSEKGRLLYRTPQIVLKAKSPQTAFEVDDWGLKMPPGCPIYPCISYLISQISRGLLLTVRQQIFQNCDIAENESAMATYYDLLDHRGCVGDRVWLQVEDGAENKMELLVYVADPHKLRRKPNGGDARGYLRIEYTVSVLIC